MAAPPPSITSLSPATGSNAGGNTVVIRGTNFSGATGVTFGGAAATITAVSSTQITVTTPAGANGLVDVAVTTPDGTDTLPNSFRYAPLPFLNSISLTTGPKSGGATITIFGSNLDTTTSVTVDGVVASGLTILTAGKITVTAPALSANRTAPFGASVIVTNPTGASNSKTYTYYDIPTVTRAVPGAGPIAGGTSVTLTGTNFYTTTDVYINNVKVTGVVNTNTSVRFTTPSVASPGPASIYVKTAVGTSITYNGLFNYVNGAPTITSVSPSTGPVYGGTSITINGTNFIDGAAVTIGGVAASGVTIVSDKQITATVPAGTAGARDVVVTTSYGSATLANGYTYTTPPAPVITAITPNSATIFGGTTVTLTGTDFVGTSSLKFGGVSATGINVISATQMTAVVPARPVGPVTVDILTPYGPGSLPNGFTYVNPPAPVITSISPNSGLRTGGNTITITGTDFTGASSVTVGGNAATYVVNSATQITATVPAGAIGPADVVVTTPYGPGPMANGYTYTPLPAPTISRIAPATGLSSGGTTILIIGTNFLPGSTVSIGGKAATGVTVDSPTQITAIVPAVKPLPPAAVDVTVTTTDGWFTLPGSFRYLAPPSVSSIAPNSGPVVGGNNIVITGGSSAGITDVTIGGNSVLGATVLSPTQLEVTVPPGSPGPADVMITTAAGTTLIIVNGYTYIPAPTITAVSPSSGPITGGTTMTLTGTDFTGATAVTIGGANAASFTVDSSTQITAVAPPGTAGAAVVDVATASGPASTTGSFTYIGPPTITSVTPPNGPLAGGTSVTLTGTNFIGVTGVTIGGVSATSYTVDSPTQITATIPPGAAGAATVAVTTASGTGPGTFTYMSPPVVGTVSPSSGPASGGTAITISGSGFNSVTGVTVGGVAATSVNVLNATTITATTPAGTPGSAAVSVTTAFGGDSKANAFTYLAPPTIGAVRPSQIRATGGTAFTISGTGFLGATGVTVGGAAASAVNAVSDDTITAIAPPGNPGVADVQVVAPGGTQILPAAVTYMAAPKVTGITPASDDIAGGATVTITGTDFSDATSVSIGGSAATSFIVDGPTQITAIIPPGTVGPADVAVGTPWGSHALSGGFSYTRLPHPRTISPRKGSVLGGTVVTITGSNFVNVQDVTFDDISATNINVISPSLMTMRTPPGLSGPVHVKIYTDDGAAMFSAGFTYVDVPAVASVTPASGPAAGGATVIIDGSAFTGATDVIFAGAAATSFTVVDDTQVTAIAPAGNPGPADVTIKTPYGSHTLSGAYTYIVTPAISAVSPASGPVGGGTSVTITGTNLAGAASVTIGGVNAASFTVDSPMQITAIVPAGTAGPAVVDVSTPLGAAHPTGSFTYIAAPKISAVSPASGPIGGGTSVTITGTDLAGATSVTIAGVNAASFTVDSPTQITAIVPAGTAGPADIGILTPYGRALAAGAYTYVVPPPPPPVTITITPANAALPDAYVGKAYQVQFSASGGSGPYRFAIQGALPNGLSFDPTAGLLSGTPKGETSSHAILLTVTDANGVSAQANYRLELKVRGVTVENKDVTVQPGFSPPDVPLDKGATGGPFSDAAVVYVDPPSAGTATITRGDVASAETAVPKGWYLQFVPNPEFSGTAHVKYRLTSISGESNTGIVTYRIEKSRTVVINEVRQHERQFIAGRQAMLDQSIRHPSLTDRRTARQPGPAFGQAFTPSADGVRLGLSFENRMGEAGEGIDIWANAAFMLRQGPSDQRTGKPAGWDSFALGSAGIDYLLSDRMLLGMAVHVHNDNGPSGEGIDIGGKGWLAGPYASAEIFGHTYLDASLLYGETSNEIRSSDYRGSFDTSLWMLRGALHGEITMKSGLLLSPRVEVTYIAEDIRDHAIRNGLGQTVAIPGFAEQQLRGSIGFDLSEEFRILGGIVVTPTLGLDIGYAGMDGDGVYTTLKPGVGIVTPGGWSIIGGVQMSFAADGEFIFGIDARATKRF